MRTMPPASSAFDLYRKPNMLPILTPIVAIKKVVQPMRETAGRIFTLKNAKVMPTAKASILVAMARGSMVRGEKEALCFSDSLRDSSTMLPPISDSSTKAIQ